MSAFGRGPACAAYSDARSEASDPDGDPGCRARGATTTQAWPAGEAAAAAAISGRSGSGGDGPRADSDRGEAPGTAKEAPRGV